MFAGTALSVRLLVYAGLSLFIICGPYVYMVVCVVYEVWRNQPLSLRTSWNLEKQCRSLRLYNLVYISDVIVNTM